MIDPFVERLCRALSHRYAFENEIGRGARSVVYVAQDLKHRRQVAIKALRPEFVSSVGGERFRREIGIAASMTHPHILPLHDSGEAEGILYYVMPYVEGETLRDHMDAKGPLAVGHAVAMARQVADALAFAHEKGVIHRDIKPENILLEDGKAVVADFGIARTYSAGVEQGMTGTGVSVGTPHYMSPEQGLGTGEITQATDIYALGCVLFEMLVGTPPFTGGSPQAVLARKIHREAPSTLAGRPDTPVWLDRIIGRMMARDPADRFDSAATLLQALDAHLGRKGGGPSGWVGRWAYGVQRNWRPLLGGAGTIALAGLVAISMGWLPGTGGHGPGDPHRLAVYSLAGPTGFDAGLDGASRIARALAEWDSLTVVDRGELAAVETQFPHDGQSNPVLAAAARSLGAGRFVRGSLAAVGTEVHLTAELRNANAQGALLASERIPIPQGREGLDSLFDHLAARLLFHDSGDPDLLESVGTRSVPSQRAYLAGQALLSQGDFAGADSAFSEAVTRDPAHAEASLWVAVSRVWRGMDPARWRTPARQAAQSPSLSSRHRVMARAVSAQADGDFPRACQQWKSLAEGESDFFGGWFGWAGCLAGDDGVLEDGASPSGWSFRTSHHSALQAYIRAFELFPNVLSSYRNGSFHDLRYLFMTTANSRRLGRSLDSGSREFWAVPALSQDTLALVPYPGGFSESELSVLAEDLEAAVRHQRRLFRDVTLAWVSASPAVAWANEAHALALAQMRDPAAMEWIRRARAQSMQSDEEVRLAGVEAMIQLAFSLPEDLDGITRARALADSVLAGAGDGAGPDPLLTAGLAAVTGRAHRAARVVRMPGVAERLGGSGFLRETGPPLLVYAALGGPRDSLRALEARLQSDIDESLLDPDRTVAHLRWVARPATLAFGENQMETVEALAGLGDYLLDFQAALARGDTASVREGLAELRRIRKGLLPSSVTLDAILPETVLWFLMGEFQTAADWLDPALRALPETVPGILTDPVRAAALTRAAALRAKIAYQAGDLEAARLWRAAVESLWADSDPFLQPRVAELQELF